ncbi:tetratricopeptide repeat protein, partial [Undibacterium sp. CCC2.1]
MNKQPNDDIFLQAVKFLKGDGVERSVDIASKLFHVAAEAGHDKAQFNLGVMYLNGIGVVKNKLLAIYWLERAASLGNLKWPPKSRQLFKEFKIVPVSATAAR